MVDKRTGSTFKRPGGRNLERFALDDKFERNLGLRNKMLFSPSEGAETRRKNADAKKSSTNEATNQKYYSRHCQASR